MSDCAFVENCTQAASCILEIYLIEYFKNVFLDIYNCAYKTLFANPVTSNQYSSQFQLFTRILAEMGRRSEIGTL